MDANVRPVGMIEKSLNNDKKTPQILRCNTQWPLIKDIVVYIWAVVHNKHEFYAAIIGSQIWLDPFVVTLFVAQ